MSAEETEQTSIRLPAGYHARLAELAEAAGQPRGTLLRQVTTALIDGDLAAVAELMGLSPGSSVVEASVADELLERMDGLEQQQRKFERLIHVNLRVLLGTLLKGEQQKESARRHLDEYLGPIPPRPEG